jgi:hypothetical protein
MNGSPRAAIILVAALFLLPWQRAAAQNLVTNPGFDTSVAGWGPAAPPPTWDGTRDADGNPSSGSAQTQNFGGVLLTCFPLLTQCVTGLVPGQTYEFGGKVFIPPGQIDPMLGPVQGSGQVEVVVSTLPNCGSPAFGGPAGPATTTTGTWFESSGFFTVPPGVDSVQLQGVTCHTLGNGTLLVNFDDMFLQPAPVGVVPTLDSRGLAVFGALLAAMALLRRRRLRSRS